MRAHETPAVSGGPRSLPGVACCSETSARPAYNTAGPQRGLLCPASSVTSRCRRDFAPVCVGLCWNCFRCVRFCLKSRNFSPVLNEGVLCLNATASFFFYDLKFFFLDHLTNMYYSRGLDTSEIKQIKIFTFLTF